MYRIRTEFLEEWLNSKQRKPLVIRGARQVGKTWLVRSFAEACGLDLIELNFEKKPELQSLFSSNEPLEILQNIEAALNISIEPSNSLLFLDEIQAAPELLSKLRWFAEELPELAVIAAGSLLEFVLSDHSFSMPVGRINYLHLEPLSFEEFLLAKGLRKLCDFIANYELKNTIPGAIHQQLLDNVKEYIIIGGMPAAVSSWKDNQSPQKVHQTHSDLLATYRDDFPKYSGKLPIERLEEVMMATPRMLGEKFVYSRINKDVQSASLKAAFQLLNQARICLRVQCCDANGIPLAAGIKEKYFKAFFLDVGLVSSALDLRLNQIRVLDDINLVNKGGISEQLVGQLLRTISPAYVEPNTYYWIREQKGSSAEIDYVIQDQNQVIPIEVKSGSIGSLKSLHLFMGQKDLKRAVRINSDLPSLTSVEVQTQLETNAQYQLLSLPFYLIGQLHRLLESL